MVSPGPAALLLSALVVLLRTGPAASAEYYPSTYDAKPDSVDFNKKSGPFLWMRARGVSVHVVPRCSFRSSSSSRPSLHLISGHSAASADTLPLCHTTFSDPAICACNMNTVACDPNCYCDPDCSDDEKALFSDRKPESTSNFSSIVPNCSDPSVCCCVQCGLWIVTQTCLLTVLLSPITSSRRRH